MPLASMEFQGYQENDEPIDSDVIAFARKRKCSRNRQFLRFCYGKWRGKMTDEVDRFPSSQVDSASNDRERNRICKKLS